MIGPKGSGKSTYLWLRGEGPQPVGGFLADGTTANVVGTSSIDTVGGNIELGAFLKQFTVLMTNEVPNTFVVFSGRFQREGLILAHLMIRDFFVCPIIPRNVFDSGANPMAAGVDQRTWYDRGLMNDLRAAGYKPITHSDPMPPLNGNAHALTTLFPTGRIELPSWADFQANPSSLNVIRFQIAKNYHTFRTKYGSNELNFLNSFTD